MFFFSFRLHIVFYHCVHRHHFPSKKSTEQQTTTITETYMINLFEWICWSSSSCLTKFCGSSLHKMVIYIEHVSIQSLMGMPHTQHNTYTYIYGINRLEWGTTVKSTLNGTNVPKFDKQTHTYRSLGNGIPMKQSKICVYLHFGF